MKISQREARRLRDEVQALKTEIAEARAYWLSDYPGGTHIGTLDMADQRQMLGRVEGVRIAGMAVVATPHGTQLRLYAVKQS